jgi:signal peptidase I
MNEKLINRFTLIYLFVAVIMILFFTISNPPSHTLKLATGESMEPTIDGDVNIVLINSQQPEIGDIGAYDGYGWEDSGLILHRVVGTKDGDYIFKGDNNSYYDPQPVPPEHTYGTAVWFYSIDIPSFSFSF